MLFKFVVNNKIDTPIYRQLANQINSLVASGELAVGTKMPTVREMADTLGVAQGTVKRAYDELETMGVIEKTQGKGTFIKEVAPAVDMGSGSRKDRAMSSIDRMFDDLEELGFSTTEIEIFLELKKRERESRHEKMKIAVVECNPETLYSLVDQLRSPELDIYPFLLDDIRRNPYKIDESMNLIITSATHFDELNAAVSQKEKLLRIALSLTTSSVYDMLMIPPQSKIGVMSQSERFGNMIVNEMEKYNLKVDWDEPITFDNCNSPESWISEKDYILLPEDYESFCGSKTADALAEAKSKGKIILCTYRMDQGSAFQVEERIRSAKTNSVKGS